LDFSDWRSKLTDFSAEISDMASEFFKHSPIIPFGILIE
jgi:hypothetical protein